MANDGLLPNSSSDVVQKTLDDKAVELMDSALDDALDAECIVEKTQVLNAYTKYKQVHNSDPVNILNKLASLSAKQVKVLEASLKKQKLLDEFKSGKIELGDVYKLPKVKQKRT